MKYFSLHELTRSSVAAAKKIDNKPSAQIEESLTMLVKLVLDPVRERIGNPITVSSGYRSPALNKAVGGVPTSQHLSGEAADILATPLKGETQKQANLRLFRVMEQMVAAGEITVGQLLDEKNFSWIHVSIPRRFCPNPKINDIRHI